MDLKSILRKIQSKFRRSSNVISPFSKIVELFFRKVSLIGSLCRCLFPIEIPITTRSSMLMGMTQVGLSQHMFLPNPILVNIIILKLRIIELTNLLSYRGQKDSQNNYPIKHCGYVWLHADQILLFLHICRSTQSWYQTGIKDHCVLHWRERTGLYCWPQDR